MTTLWIALIAYSSLVLSSVAGYGGSLLLVPALVSSIGAKEGIALAALMLATNNVCKVVVYRKSLGLRRGWPLIPVSIIGALIGGIVFIELPSAAIVTVVCVVTAAGLAADVFGSPTLHTRQRLLAAPLLGVSSVLSGISGSSGPLKGIAIRSMRLGRLEHVGLASCVSLAADATKTEVFRRAGIFGMVDVSVLWICLPAMPIAAIVGRTVNTKIGENSFRTVFWLVVGGYLARVLLAW